MAWWKSSRTYTVLRILTGLVFAVTGVSKALAPDAFLAQLRAYQLFPASLLAVTVFAVIMLELVLAAMLLLNRRPWIALWAAGAMTIGFLAVIASAWLRGLQIDCGCLIGVSERAGPLALARDSVLLAIIVWALVLGQRGSRAG